MPVFGALLILALIVVPVGWLYVLFKHMLHSLSRDDDWKLAGLQDVPPHERWVPHKK